MANTNLLTKAAQVVTVRQAKYGSPTEDFTRVAAMWSILFKCEVKPEQVAQAMIMLKLSRMMESYHPDNALDICGYAQCHETVMEEVIDKMGDHFMDMYEEAEALARSTQLCSYAGK